MNPTLTAARGLILSKSNNSTTQHTALIPLLGGHFQDISLSSMTVTWLNHLWERTTTNQPAFVNKTIDMNLSLQEIEDQFAMSMGISNFKRPQCLLNKMT